MSNDTNSYGVDKLGSRCYVFTQPDTPHEGYVLLMSTLRLPMANCQLVLAAFKNDNPNSKFFTLYQEHYNLQFYAHSVLLRTIFIDRLVKFLLESDDLANPIQTALTFGGTVLGENVKTPPPFLREFH